MSGLTTSSLSLAWSLRNWVILGYEEANGLTIRPWAPFLLSFYLFLWRLATDGKEEPAVCQRLALNNFSISCLFHRLTPDRSSKQPDGALSRVIEHTCNGSRDSSPANHVITHNLWNSFHSDLLVGPYLAVTCLLSLLSVWLVMIRLRKGLLAITYISCFLILQIFGQVPIHHLSRACFSIIYIRSYLASSFIFIVVTGRNINLKLQNWNRTDYKRKRRELRSTDLWIPFPYLLYS